MKPSFPNPILSPPDIIAEIRFLSTDAGGRKQSTPAQFFGCLFEYEGKTFDCRLLLETVGAIAPGQTATAPIIFLFPEIIKTQLFAGAKFRLWEMGTIAYGTVLEEPRLHI